MAINNVAFGQEMTISGYPGEWLLVDRVEVGQIRVRRTFGEPALQSAGFWISPSLIRDTRWPLALTGGATSSPSHSTYDSSVGRSGHKVGSLISKPTSESCGEDDLRWALAGVEYLMKVEGQAPEYREQLKALRQRVTDRIRAAAGG